MQVKFLDKPLFYFLNISIQNDTIYTAFYSANVQVIMCF